MSESTGNGKGDIPGIVKGSEMETGSDGPPAIVETMVTLSHGAGVENGFEGIAEALLSPPAPPGSQDDAPAPKGIEAPFDGT
jgi:hypothetical protein